MASNHDRGTVAVFVSCADRETLDKLRSSEQKRTGYPITLKALISKIIRDASK